MSRIECVPNFSDGRDPAVAADLRAQLLAVPGVKLLGWHSDADHNRSVATFAGEPSAVTAAAFAAIARARELIDVTRHEGVHPRIGATDVCPFVPLAESALRECVDAAHALGARVGRELGLPVYFYGAAARTEERRELPAVRRGGFEELRVAIQRDPSRRPDEGPARLHPRAGAIAIGARGYLVAFNVNLESTDLALARSIARAIRERDGGLPGIRALGFELARAGCVQVSVNLCDPARTGLEAVFAEVARLAGARGVRVRASELVGLAPRFALDARIARAVQLPDFVARRDVLEDALEA